jgi:cytidylate kinase
LQLLTPLSYPCRKDFTPLGGVFFRYLRANNYTAVSDIIIAIDGYSACGKSTLARDLASHLGYTYIDTGAMYRAVTLYFLDHQVDHSDAQAVMKALDSIRIRFQPASDGAMATFLNGQNVEDEIRSMRVSGSVSEVAALSAVRRAMVREQQEMGMQKRVVLDGRDIGTVVFPQAELKIFLTADFEERLRRRFEELRRGGSQQALSSEEVADNLRKRDHIDSTRADSPLRQAQDAKRLDNTTLDRESQLELVLKWVRELTGYPAEQQNQIQKNANS